MKLDKYYKRELVSIAIITIPEGNDLEPAFHRRKQIFRDDYWSIRQYALILELFRKLG